MDLVLHYADEWFFTPYFYPESWKPDDIYRQTLSLEIFITVSTYVIYLVLATLNYCLTYDQKLMEHPQFHKVCLFHFISQSVFIMVSHLDEKQSFFII